MKKLDIVLAGQANVGKSVIFNHLTGLHQHIGNWPGKTIEKAEGNLFYKGYSFHILDLPGIYSLTSYSAEELISREYIILQEPDLIINVTDATNLERNLLFTLQLLELEKPLVLALNMMDLAKKKGIEIDVKELGKILGVPIAETVASRRYGLTEVLDHAIELQTKKPVFKGFKYGKEVESRIEKLTGILQGSDLTYPVRWLSIKLLEKDEKVEKILQEIHPEIIETAEKLCAELEEIHGHDSSILMADERCHLVSHIIKNAVKIIKPQKKSFNEKLDDITSDKVFGYPVMLIILVMMFLAIFTFGNWLSSRMDLVTDKLQNWWETSVDPSLFTSLAFAALESTLALVQLALPYILPFYILLYFLEDGGYLARISFLTDHVMHKVGVHGKACIPLFLGFGCNVPACLAARIMETERERFITGFLTTLVPCSAVTVIIIGLTGKYLGIGWAFGLYVFAILVVFLMGRLATKIIPGEATELIMMMPDYKRPQLRTIFLQTWFRLKEFIWIAAPLVIISGIIIEGIYAAGWLSSIANGLYPLTVKWLGLPVMTGIVLIFGILRKELILVMLVTLYGTNDFSQILSPVQMITLALVCMFYIPCIATIAALWKEFGWKKALGISVIEISFAVLIAGLAARILKAFL
ncbi:MAG: hypothetical protein AMS26_15420 [Bacteroides sp. SM23_62]|nr:MAG: hypothetical protein AMS26_15420 [Bacteroides sp. SM23_62]